MDARAEAKRIIGCSCICLWVLLAVTFSQCERAEIHLRSLFFLGLVFTGIQIFIWILIPTGFSVWTILGASLLAVAIFGDPFRRKETPYTLGFRKDNFLAAMKLVVFPSLLLGLGIVAIGYMQPANHSDLHLLLKRFLIILPWGLFQQGIFQCVFNRRLCMALGKGWKTAILNGFCFGFIHLPGVAMTTITTTAGIGWSWAYQKQPNIWVLVISHALLSSLAQTFLPGEWTHGFRVGVAYYHWHS